MPIGFQGVGMGLGVAVTGSGLWSSRVEKIVRIKGFDDDKVLIDDRRVFKARRPNPILVGFDYDVGGLWFVYV